jgi:hypothetical protein
MNNISGIAGIVNHDGSVPRAPPNTEFAYTSQLTDDVYQVTFRTPFNRTPSVLVTASVANPNDDLDSPLVTPVVYEVTAGSFMVKFWTFVPASGGNLNEFIYVKRAFSFAALETTTEKKG